MPTLSDLVEHEERLKELMLEFGDTILDNLTMGQVDTRMFGLMYEVRTRYYQLQVEILSRMTARHVVPISRLFDNMGADLTKDEAQLLEIMDGVVASYRETARVELLARDKVRMN